MAKAKQKTSRGSAPVRKVNETSKKTTAGRVEKSKTSKATSKAKTAAIKNELHSMAASSSSKSSSASSDGFLAGLLTEPVWKEKLGPVFEEDFSKQLDAAVAAEYKSKEIFPPKDLIFNAFNTTPFDEVKVVILGQDPYHDNNQAHGLSFSVPDGIAHPPSLKNMFKELSSDIDGFTTPQSGCLQKWCEEGVLLLNAALTVHAHQANSHAKLGWHTFTDEVFKILSAHKTGIVFLLWGGFAHKKEKLIDQKVHTVIKTAHPSPLSFNKFKDCKCFSQVNKELVKLGLSPVDWRL